MSRLHATIQARFIPLSGQHGQNVKTPPKEDMPWHTGSTLLEALATFTPPARAMDETLPLRLPVQVRGAGIDKV